MGNEMKRGKNKMNAKAEAKKVLAKMNNILRSKPFTTAIKEDNDNEFGELQDELYDLGLLGFCEEQPSRENGGYVQLKLISRDSKEARDMFTIKNEDY